MHRPNGGTRSMTIAKSQRDSEGSTTTLWSDNESSVDLLRFDYLAAEVAAVVTSKQLLPVTVGVYGNWGSGKSTLIRMVERILGEQEDVLTLQFNGWLF